MHDKPTPVILDTDLGDDIDDTWALAMLLKSPELDLKLVVTEFGNTPLRARIAAKFLTAAGRNDVPLGIGIKENDNATRQGPWVDDFPLSAYSGKVYEDGVQALIDTIVTAPEPITLICIGPMPNIREALRREPRIAENAHFVGMQGSVFVGYNGKEPRSAEWNVRANSAACRAAFEAPWLSRTITPLDTCGRIRLDGERFAQLRRSADPALRALFEGYDTWASGHDIDSQRISSVLYDTVAVFLAFSSDYTTIQRLGLTVTDGGETAPSDDGPLIDAAVAWTDMDGYKDFLTRRLLSATVPATR